MLLQSSMYIICTSYVYMISLDVFNYINKSFFHSTIPTFQPPMILSGSRHYVGFGTPTAPLVGAELLAHFMHELLYIKIL